MRRLILWVIAILTLGNGAFVVRDSDGVIHRIYAVRNPDKLKTLRA